MSKPPTKREVKVALNQRLHAEKRFDDYVVERERLKRDGVSNRDAWRIAAQKFPPLDGSPVEVDPPGETAVKREPAAASEQPEEFFLDGEAWSGDETHQETTPEPIELKGQGPYQYTRTIQPSPAPPGNSHTIKELIDAIGSERQAGEREVAQWVFNNAITPFESLDPLDVPSLGALQLLRWVQTSTTNYTEFIRSIWSKMLPNKSQLDLENRFNDDGRKQFQLLEEFERSLNEGSAAA